MESAQKLICKTRAVDCSLSAMWQRWTTHEGLLTFFGRDNKIELRPNGAFEIYFLTGNPYGLRGSERCKVLSFIPEEMFSFTWNAPPRFPEARASDAFTWVVVEFARIRGGRTEVTLRHLGWPDDARWEPVFGYFDEAWDSVLDSLEESVRA